MNRLIDISTRLVGYALILLMVSGCIAERPVACPDDDASSAQLSLRLAVQEIRSLRATEAGDDALNENKIERLQILFYKGGTLYWSVSPAPATDGNYSIPIPEAQQQGFDGNSTYNVYVVTNMAFTAPQQESELAKIVVTESVADKPNAKFVMQGKTSKQINLKTPEGKQLGTVKLRRVASKLRITPTVQVTGYELGGEIQVKFVGATDRGYLMAEESATGASAIDYAYRATQDQQPQLFYSYYSNWSSNPDQAPYYLLTVPLKKAGETTVVNNYYRVALTPEEPHFTANKLYDLKLGIHKLGSTTPEEPVAITGTLSILPWTLCDDQYDLPAANYLEVSEREAHIYNVETHTISYESSKKPVTIQIVEVSFSYVNGATGEAITEAIPNSSNQYPTVTVVGNQIEIQSKLPINNIPKKIRFKVSNGITELDKEVTVYQYPSHFITHTNGAKSSRRPNGRLADGLNNKAIYRITVQNPPKDMILGFPPRETTDFWPGYWNGSRWVLNGGNKTSKLTTKRDAETAQMVSPSFELASQLGATERWPYLEYGWTEGGSWFNPTWSRTNKIGAFEETALCDCALYTETRIVDGQEVTLDDWRLPTEAEIRLIDQLQNDPNSAVKAIMTGAYYWSAKSDAAIELQGGSEGSTSRAYTRCVRDVKDPTIQSHIPYRLDR